MMTLREGVLGGLAPLTFVAGGACVYWSVNLKSYSDAQSSRYSTDVIGVVVYVSPLRLAFRYSYAHAPCPNDACAVVNGWLPTDVYDNASTRGSVRVSYDPSEASCSVLADVPGRQDPTFDPCDVPFLSAVAYSPWTWQFLMLTGILLMTSSMWFTYRVMHRIRFSRAGDGQRATDSA